MKRSAFQAREKYSWRAKTFDFAESLRWARSSGKCRAVGDLRATASCRAEGQGLCRRQPLPDQPVRIPSAPMSPPLSRDRLASLLAASARRRVAVIGDAMLDVYLRGDVDRVSPEA